MKNEVVIARYSENLDWVRDIPRGFHVTIYNKGASTVSSAAAERADSIVSLENSGRESDTFVRHILDKTDFSDGFTVFLQGNPFDHSPDLIRLLEVVDQWRDIQPLSWGWLSSLNVPPPDILARETGDYVAGTRVRSEYYSLLSWMPVQFYDPGTKAVAELYRKQHRLAAGANIAADFLRRCEWGEAADQAERNLVGRLSYGALFAVRQERLARLQKRSLELALEAANGHWMYGYILERLWLHMMGEPFFLRATNPASSVIDPTQKSRFIPPDTKTPPYLRLEARIKRKIAKWAQS